MESLIAQNISKQKGISAADALWSLIAAQSKSTRRVLTEKLVSDDIELAEHLLLKASIERGWQQVKAMQENGGMGDSLQNLIDEMKKG
ncbi:MAG: hypothetical protein J6S82_02395 [Bacteroidales bacterium]|jgi:hypothetical protein|nr:hypothetical protein [Bacteroidales bacterium]MBR4340795.1 hypothetical protein [Bacteroidales bacterium]